MPKPLDHAQAIASTMPVFLVGCSAEKLEHAAPARDLYRSQLFRAARGYAERRGPWAILSGLHGLVLPDQVLEPYDFSATRMRAMGAQALARWGEEVAARLDRIFPRARFVLLAGDGYRAGVKGLPKNRLSEPLKGLGIGKRLAWFRRESFEPTAVAQ